MRIDIQIPDASGLPGVGTTQVYNRTLHNFSPYSTSIVPAKRLVPGHKPPSEIPQDIAAVFPEIISTVTKYISLGTISID
jgi:hypothetical protein